MVCLLSFSPLFPTKVENKSEVLFCDLTCIAKKLSTVEEIQTLQVDNLFFQETFIFFF